MKILKYVVIALLTLGVISPSTSLFAADPSDTGSTNKVSGADTGKKKDKKTAKDKKVNKKKKSDGSADGSDSSTDANK